MKLKSILIKFFELLGIGITSKSNLKSLLVKQINYDSLLARLEVANRDITLVLDLVKIGAVEPANHQNLVMALKSSKSQLRQEVFCLIYNNWKKGGYFVEFGAFDGIADSNTLSLERDFNWTGILAEPNLDFHSALKYNRKCIIETVAIGAEPRDARSFISFGNLSTFAEYADKDVHNRSGGTCVNVETVTLTKLLDRNFAPNVIDFLSVDTEGSELEILYTLDFDRYSFNFICIEHNYTHNHSLIIDLMSKNGYKEVMQSHSQWDSFFIPNN